MDKLWNEYCLLIGVNPKDEKNIKSEYYQKGFKLWADMQKEFNYYQHNEQAINRTVYDCL